MGHVKVNYMDKLREDTLSRASKIRTQLTDFKLSRVASAARGAQERISFVTENSRNVNRILKEFHDSRLANGQQNRADKIAFVAHKVKEKAAFIEQAIEQADAIHKELLQSIYNASSAFRAEAAINAAWIIKAMNSRDTITASLIIKADDDNPELE
jgi:hypothetical protein